MRDDAIVAELDINAPRNRVFRALIDSKDLAVWWDTEPTVKLNLFEIDPRVGGRWRYECSDRAGRSVNGVSEYVAHGEILEMDPPRLLVYTWIANWHDHPDATTIVRWELESSKRGTHVRVTHTGLADQPVARKDYGEGWNGVLELLRKFVEKVVGGGTQSVP